MLTPKSQAPLSISVLDERGRPVSLEDRLGSHVVLYFYPKDNTPGCTKEACSFRDYYQEIMNLGAQVIGVSTDSVASHTKFKQQHQLNFELWSDPEHELIEAFGAWQKKKFMGREYYGTVRSTFLINPDGEIVKVWEKVTPAHHGEEIVEYLKTGLTEGET